MAWKDASTGLSTGWNADNNGNYLGNAIGVMSGSSAALGSLETSFQQDLNGDGVIGLPGHTIESFGSTSLDQIGNNYFLGAGTAAPLMKYAGAAVMAGQVVGGSALGAGATGRGVVGAG